MPNIKTSGIVNALNRIVEALRKLAISSVPAGGTTGQVLSKNSDTAFDVEWSTPTGGGSSGGGGEGILVNGKIVVTVTSNNITLALKTLAGTNPSSIDKVQIQINGVIREITSALSVTKNAATNWFNAGSAELATKEIDYFVYLGYNATDGVTLGFSRIPGANCYSDFSVTTTNEKYCAISTITNAASTDYYENVGRFAATLSAGAGYTWSVPTFTAINLIQRPIFETRLSTYAPVTTGFSVAPTLISRYKIVGSNMSIFITYSGTGTSNTTAFTLTTPFSLSFATSGEIIMTNRCFDNGSALNTPMAVLNQGSNVITLYTTQQAGGWTASGGKTVELNSTYPI